MKKLALKDKVGLALLAAALITNPLTGQYILESIEWAFSKLFTVGPWIMLTATAYMIFYMGIVYAKSEKVNIPKNAQKKSAKKARWQEYEV